MTERGESRELTGLLTAEVVGTNEFIDASQSGQFRGDDLSSLLKTERMRIRINASDKNRIYIFLLFGYFN